MKLIAWQFRAQICIFSEHIEGLIHLYQLVLFLGIKFVCSSPSVSGRWWSSCKLSPKRNNFFGNALNLVSQWGNKFFKILSNSWHIFILRRSFALLCNSAVGWNIFPRVNFRTLLGLWSAIWSVWSFLVVKWNQLFYCWEAKGTMRGLSGAVPMI